MKTDNIILLVGESGSGKTTICNELYKRYGLSSIESYTTRLPRYKNEKGHIFINDEEADYILSNEEIVGYTEFDGNRYFATASQVEESDIYVIDKAGVEYFDENYTGNKNVIVVYVKVSDAIRLERMANERGLHEASNRLMHDRMAFKNISYIADYTIENIDLDESIEKIYRIWKGVL